MKFLQEAKEKAFGPKQTIIERLVKDLSGYEPARSHETVHASDITKTNFCPRQTALLDITKGKKKDEWISAPLRVTFDVGNVTSDLFREQWASKWCYGDWVCMRCKEQRSFCLKPEATPCNAGFSQNLRHFWRYKEMSYVSQQYDVSGSLDAVCDLGAPLLFVTELKIMTPVDFEKLAAPLPEHRIRTSLYLKLIADSNSAYKSRLNLERGKVLYISRAYGKMHEKYKEILPFKEFDVVRDDAALKPYLDKAVSVSRWRKQKKIPAGICNTSADKPAKSCSMCAQCFSGKFGVDQ